MEIKGLFEKYLPSKTLPDGNRRDSSNTWTDTDLIELVKVLETKKQSNEKWDEVIKTIWNQAEVLESSSGSSQAKRLLAWSLFDFSTSPPSGTRPQPQKSVQIDASSELLVPGIANVECFPGTPVVNRAAGKCKISHFARSVVLDSSYSGVFCLAGNRGSGKSHALHYLTQACYLYDHKHLPPLAVRWNIGTTFENREFIIDAIEDICRTVEYRCEVAPYFNVWTCFKSFYFSVARVFELLSLNIRWAIQTLVLVVIGLILLDLLPGQTNDSNGSQGFISKPNLVVVAIGLSILAAFGMVLRIRRTPWLRTRLPLRCRVPFIAACSLVSLLGIFVAFYLAGLECELFGVQRGHTTTQDIGLSGWVARGTVPVLALCAGLFAPRWWEFYSRCRQLRQQLRNMHTDSELPILNFLTPLGEWIKTLLPTTRDRMAVQDMQWPFLQDFLRLLVADCQREFGRVVILIDDVDMLPPEKFHDFFRILRPLTRVPNTCIVIAVPKFLHDVIRLDTTNDLHSTVRDVIFLGDPKLYDANGKQKRFFETKPGGDMCKRVLRPSIEQLIVNRCVLPVPDAGPWADFLIESLTKAYQEQIANEVDDTQPAARTELPESIWEYLVLEQITRRETIRLLEQAVKGSALLLLYKQIEADGARIYGDYALSDIALDPRIDRQLDHVIAADRLETFDADRNGQTPEHRRGADGNIGPDEPPAGLVNDLPGPRPQPDRPVADQPLNGMAYYLPLRNIYHRSRDCVRVRGANRRLKQITMKQAQQAGMQPCQKCHGQ